MTLQKNEFKVDDPIELAPQHYRVLLENERVRVLEYRSRPGDKSSVHSHPDSVIYSFQPATLTVSGLIDEKRNEVKLQPGEVIWRREITHAVENTGDTDARLLVVELKNAAEPVPLT